MHIFEEGGIPMAGRKPKPTALKKLEGNPGKRKLNTKEPVPGKRYTVYAQSLVELRKKERQIIRDGWLSVDFGA